MFENCVEIFLGDGRLIVVKAIVVTSGDIKVPKKVGEQITTDRA